VSGMPRPSQSATASETASEIMTNEEINKYIWADIMGAECFHQDAIDWRQSEPDYQCKMCHYDFPRYTSEDSPRALLNAVVAKVRGIVGIGAINRTFTEYVVSDYAIELAMIQLTAERIARACVEAHKSAK